MLTTTQLIESELDHNAKRRMRALAQGRWQTAADCGTVEDALIRLKERLVENEAGTKATGSTGLVPP